MIVTKTICDICLQTMISVGDRLSISQRQGNAINSIVINDICQDCSQEVFNKVLELKEKANELRNNKG